MNNDVAAQLQGAPPELTENGKPVEAHYSKRFCPELSTASLALPENAIVGVDGQKKGGPHFEGCRGMACMLFIAEVNKEGQVINGNCAKAVQAGSANSSVQILLALLQKVKVAKLKI